MEHQGELLLTRPSRSTIGEEVIHAQRSFSAAIALAVSASGLDDKEVYITLEIDASHWTKIRKGEANFPVDKLNRLMDLLGNEVPLRWLAHSRGYGLHLIQSESERRLQAAEQRALGAEEKLRYLESLVTGAKS